MPPHCVFLLLGVVLLPVDIVTSDEIIWMVSDDEEPVLIEDYEIDRAGVVASFFSFYKYSSNTKIMRVDNHHKGDSYQLKLHTQI